MSPEEAALLFNSLSVAYMVGARGRDSCFKWRFDQISDRDQVELYMKTVCSCSCLRAVVVQLTHLSSSFVIFFSLIFIFFFIFIILISLLFFFYPLFPS